MNLKNKNKMEKREIRFRGLLKEYNPAYHQSKWRYGNLLNPFSIGEVGANLDSYEYAEVLPETVGQFTGLKDRNGKEIYEGDIVTNTDGDKRKIVYYEMMFEMRLLNGKKDSAATTWYYEVEVIGNIYENPDLIPADPTSH